MTSLVILFHPLDVTAKNVHIRVSEELLTRLQFPSHKNHLADAIDSVSNCCFDC